MRYSRRSSSAAAAERHQQRYRKLAAELAAELATVGFISPGSLVVRHTSCGEAGCRCQADPPQRHGPYYRAELYRGWIANRHRIETIITKTEETSWGSLSRRLTVLPATPRLH